MTSDIVVIGSCNVDLISYSDHFPKPGETLCGSSFSVGCGGKGANQCVMAAKLGANVAMISSVGDDNFGEMFLKEFKKENVNIECMHIEAGISTGVAQILVNKEGENCIIIVKGANGRLTTEHVQQKCADVIKKAKVVMFQLEIDLNVTLTSIKFCKENGCFTIFNPAPAVSNLSDDFLKYTTLLCCNETEAEILSGLQVDSPEKRQGAIKGLLQKGPEYVVLTLGSQGAMFAQKGGSIQHVVPDQSVVPDKIVDTTVSETICDFYTVSQTGWDPRQN
ncbi:ribokinase-like isoform X1 [Clytia hemisphaerica]